VRRVPHGGARVGRRLTKGSRCLPLLPTSRGRHDYSRQLRSGGAAGAGVCHRCRAASDERVPVAAGTVAQSAAAQGIPTRTRSCRKCLSLAGLAMPGGAAIPTAS
jgi:hypothetical protein